jgi:hypothetical protein
VGVAEAGRLGQTSLYLLVTFRWPPPSREQAFILGRRTRASCRGTAPEPIYFTLTGLHGIHILGGMAVMAYFLGPGAKMYKTKPEQFTNRIEYTGLYWHFVDLVWIFLFPVLYLL